MEHNPVDTGSAKKSEKSEQKSTSKADGVKRAPVEGFFRDGVETKSKDKSLNLTDFLRRTEEGPLGEPKLFSKAREESTVIDQKEPLTGAATLEAPKAETKPDTAAEWTDIEQRLRADPDFVKSFEAIQQEAKGASPAVAEVTPRREPETHVPTTELPLDKEGEQELALSAQEARDLHTRVQHAQPETAPLRNQDQPPEEPLIEHSTPEPTELWHGQTPPETPPTQTGESGGGNNFEPPRPPFGNERPADEPQPERPSQDNAAWQAQAERQHKERLADALPVNEVPPTRSAPETRVVEQGGGAAAALLVGAVDWFGRRRLRRELRRGQRQQNQQIKQGQQRQKEMADRFQNQMRTQQTATERLRTDLTAQLERTTSMFRHSEQERRADAQRIQQLNEKQKTALRPEALPKVLAAAIAGGTIEQAVLLPRDHHLEKSSWHAIEVDKTGRVVEKPVFSYGREFKREQKAESRQGDVRAVTGATALQAAGSASDDTQASQSQRPALPKPSTMGAIESTIRQRTSGLQGSVPGVVREPWFGIVVIVIIFALIAILIVA